MSETNYAVEAQGVGESSWAGNSLVFATREEADAYGRNLYSRWFGCQAVRTVTTTEPVNYTFVDGRTIRLED